MRRRSKERTRRPLRSRQIPKAAAPGSYRGILGIPLSLCRKPALRTGVRTLCKRTQKWASLLPSISEIGCGRQAEPAFVAANHLKSKRGDEANKNAGLPAAAGAERRALADPGQLLFAAPSGSGARRSAADRGRAWRESSGTLPLATGTQERADRHRGPWLGGFE